MKTGEAFRKPWSEKWPASFRGHLGCFYFKLLLIFGAFRYSVNEPNVSRMCRARFIGCAVVHALAWGSCKSYLYVYELVWVSGSFGAETGQCGHRARHCPRSPGRCLHTGQSYMPRQAWRACGQSLFGPCV